MNKFATLILVIIMTFSFGVDSYALFSDVSMSSSFFKAIDYAEKNQHGKIMVVGTLIFSLVVGMTVPDISGKAIANLEYESVKHLAPVFVNDTIYARTIILAKKESSSKNDRGVVYIETIASNQNGEDVLSFKRKVLIKKKVI